MCQQHGYKNLISYNKRKENNKGIVEHKNYRLCQKGSLAKKMKKDKNILFTVNLLSIKDLQSVRSMDASSGFQVEQWLEDNSEYAWGIFKNGTDELIGYCTIGYGNPRLMQLHAQRQRLKSPFAVGVMHKILSFKEELQGTNGVNGS